MRCEGGTWRLLSPPDPKCFSLVSNSPDDAKPTQSLRGGLKAQGCLEASPDGHICACPRIYR